ncbi:MAG: DUF4339 domain-containing protein [Gimesia sp.]|nr:DUF4339 domain-containing protein [Gimesia sp.]
MSRDNWYYKQLDEECGPISFEELFAMAHQGKLTPQMDIKNGESGNWFPARDIDGLFQTESDQHAPASDELPSLDEFSIVDSSYGVEPKENLPSLDGFSIVEDEDKLSSDLESQAPRFATLEAVRSKHQNIQWFCRVLNQELGPMSAEDLMQLLFDGELAPNDKVKSSAEPDWVAARTVAFLSSIGGDLDEDEDEDEESEQVDSASENAEVESQTKQKIPEPAKPPILKARSKQKWYCKLGGMGYGPIEPYKIKLWAEQDRVEPTDLLKLGRKGEWFEAWQIEALQLKKPVEQQPSQEETPTAETKETETKLETEPLKKMETATPAQAIPPPMPVTPPPPRPKPKMKVQRTNPLEALEPLMKPQILGGVAAVVVLAAVFYFVPLGGLFSPGGHEELAKLQAVHKEFLALQQKQASESEWSSFNNKVMSEMTPMIKELEANASSSNPHMQHLMWAARDHLKKMLDNAQQKNNPDQTKFENQLKEAERLIDK